MTAIARGIILSGDLGKLVVEASDAEVARFGQRQLVEVRALQDAPTRRISHYYGPASDTTWPIYPWSDFSDELSVQARLLTRCNCERRMMVQMPPPPSIKVPMVVTTPLTVSAGGWASAEQSFQTRTFAFARMTYTNGQRCAEYLEEA